MKLPDLAELLALRGAARGLDLHARRPLLSRLQGARRSAWRGRGLEFEELRPYVAGDNVRDIDWRVTARRGRVHTRLYREERERPVWLLADLHPGMFFGSRRQLKSAALLRAAALLTWAAVLGGDRVGAVIGGGAAAGAPLLLPPRAREAGAAPLLQALTAAQPRRAGEAAAAGGLDALLKALAPLLHPGALVLLLSDFSSLDAAAADRLAGLAAHGDGRLLWLVDPLECNGLPDGVFRVGLSPKQAWTLDGERSRAAWRAAWEQRQLRLQALSERLRLPLNTLRTDQDMTLTLTALLRESP